MASLVFNTQIWAGSINISATWKVNIVLDGQRLGQDANLVYLSVSFNWTLTFCNYVLQEAAKVKSHNNLWGKLDGSFLEAKVTALQSTRFTAPVSDHTDNTR